MSDWPTHLLLLGDPRCDPGSPLDGYIPKRTACGLKLGNRTWRGYETRTGELSVDAKECKDDITCKKCLRSKAWQNALTKKQIQARYREFDA